LCNLGEILLRAGLSVIVDATFLRRWQREQFRELARTTNVRLWIVVLETPFEVLRQRVAQRHRERTDPSEATTDVLEVQLRTRERLTEEEQTQAIIVDGERPDVDGLVSVLR
jgi:predicted kinase